MNWPTHHDERDMPLNRNTPKFVVEPNGIGGSIIVRRLQTDGLDNLVLRTRAEAMGAHFVAGVPVPLPDSQRKIALITGVTTVTSPTAAASLTRKRNPFEP